MKDFFRIVVFVLSWTMFTSSLLAHTMIPSVSHEMTCCKEVNDENSTCHIAEHSEKKEHNHCEGNCPTHDCCTHTSTFKNFVQINLEEKSEAAQLISQKIKNEFYRSNHLQDFTFPFWNPPQFVV